MNILRENIEQLNDVITIEITPDDYREKVDKSLKDLRRKANIPGFRIGHVPIGMIHKMYGKSVLAEEISKIVNDNLLNYLKENNINILFEPLALPDKTKGDFDKHEDNFSLSFEIGIHPEFDIKYDEFNNINYLKINASEKEIEKEIHDLQHKMGKFSSTEEVANDDLLLATVLAEGDNKEEYTANLLLNYIKEEKLNNIIGKKVKDILDINTEEVFKSDNERATFLKIKIDDLANAAKNIRLRIDSIHHIEPAALDEEFFSKAFPNKEVKDEKSLREHVAKKIELSHERDEKMVFRMQVMKAIVEKIKIDLPDNFIKRYLLDSDNQEYNLENIEDKYEEAKKSILYQLIEDKVSKDGEIKVDRVEVVQYIKDYIISSYFGVGYQNELSSEEDAQVTKMANDMAAKSENVKNAFENLMTEKIITEFQKRINPTIKKVTFEEFIESLQDKPTIKKENKTKN